MVLSNCRCRFKLDQLSQCIASQLPHQASLRSVKHLGVCDASSGNGHDERSCTGLAERLKNAPIARCELLHHVLTSAEAPTRVASAVYGIADRPAGFVAHN